MTVTENYGLQKPEERDYYSISVFNANADTVDAELKKNADDIDLATHEWQIVLTTDKWSSSFPHTQTVQVEGMKAVYAPCLALKNTGLSNTEIKAQIKAWGLCYRAETAENTLTVYAREVPAVDLTIIGKGI